MFSFSSFRIRGHKTDSMFRRYAISAENDPRAALSKTQEHLKTVVENIVEMPKLPQPAHPTLGRTGTKRGQSARVVAQAVGK